VKLKAKIRAKATRHAMAIGLWSFFLAGLSSLASQTGAERIDVFVAGLALLLFVILVGIVFDVVGVAATVAREPPLHARAARRVFGATHALRLVRNAHQVASFCNDVVGDVSGTLSGAIGVTLILKFLDTPGELEMILGTTLMTACIAALVVGGKAYGKVLALERGTEIIFRIGQLVACLDRVVPFDLTSPDRGALGRSRGGKR
jgi:hypothetical protein